MPANELSFSTSILIIMYFGDIVFAISGALTAAKSKMDVIGFLLIGTITGIGGGTIRDLLLGRTVWWTTDPTELIICVIASLITYFWITSNQKRHKIMIWADALGMAAFAVAGCHVALVFGVPIIVAVFMGMITATGGGLVRDILTNSKPIIMTGELYATAALFGSLGYAGLRLLDLKEGTAEIIAFCIAFILRALAIKFNIRMGPPGEFIKTGNNTQKKD